MKQTNLNLGIIATMFAVMLYLEPITGLYCLLATIVFLPLCVLIIRGGVKK